MAQHQTTFRPRRQHLLIVALIAIGLYVLLPQFGDFHSSWQLIRHPKASFVLIAIGLTLISYLAAAGTYYLLAFKPLKFARTVLVQLAAMFINRLLPAGSGAVGANYLYLRHERHTSAQAATVVALNNLLGFLGNFLLIVATLLLFHGQRVAITIHHGSSITTLLKVLGVIVVVLVAAGLVFGYRKVAKVLADIRKQFLSYRHRPWSVLTALGSSIALTLCNVLCLSFCLQALGIHLGFVPILLVFTFGVGAGAAVPTPGGLGGFEAGLAAGFVAYGVDPSPALAVALLYRLVSYWLPLGIGAAAFVISQRRKLFGR